MLEKIIKEQGVNDSEKILTELSESNFFGLWSYTNLFRDEGITQNNTGKEICDLFVIHGDEVIIISDKVIKFNENKELNIAWKRWYKKSVLDSCTQLYGAESWIKKFPERVYLDKYCKNKFPLPLEDIKKIHLITVTDDLKDTMTRYIGGESISFLMDYTESKGPAIDNPFFINDVNPKKSFVHVFNKSTFKFLINELTTITDFVNYLTSKEKAVREKRLLVASGEEDVLATYLSNSCEKYKLGTLDTQKEPFLVNYGLWNEFLETTDFSDMKAKGYRYRSMDRLISLLTDAVLNAEVGLGKDKTTEDHEKIIRMLTREPRVSRIMISMAFEDKYEEIPKDRRSSRICPSIYYDDVTYIFVFLPLGNLPIDKYRQKRTDLSNIYALVAKRKHPELKKVVLIATQTKGHDISSEDIYYYNYTQDLTNEEKIHADKAAEEFSILNDTTNASANFYEGIKKNKRSKTVKVGRNDLCPCKSGLKYKKCCINK